MVVDCGGGTVDITVHEIVNTEDKQGGQLREMFQVNVCQNCFPFHPLQNKDIFQATGGPYGSITVDEAFEQLLMNIFGRDFMTQFRCVA